MYWYTKKPKFEVSGERNLAVLKSELNNKYGSYNYAEDLRNYDTGKEFNVKFKEILNTVEINNKKSILIVGANSGYEVDFIDNKQRITALDLSTTALERLHRKYPSIKIMLEDAISIPSSTNTFDLIIAMRVIHSSNLDLIKILEELLRVTKCDLIISISKGYYTNNICNFGMYDYSTKTIDPVLPYVYKDKIIKFLETKNIFYTVIEVTSEIIFVIKKLDLC